LSYAIDAPLPDAGADAAETADAASQEDADE